MSAFLEAALEESVAGGSFVVTVVELAGDRQVSVLVVGIGGDEVETTVGEVVVSLCVEATHHLVSVVIFEL